MTKKDTLQTMASIIGKYFEVKSDIINSQTTSLEVDGWDSVSYTGLLLQVEDEFGIVIPPDKAWEFKNVGEMCQFIDQIGEDVA